MKNKFAKSVFSVSIITFLIKVINFIREVLMAQRFGTSYEVDSLIIASTIPLVLTGLVGVALNSVLIPIFTEKRIKGEYKELNNTSNKINTLLIIITITLIIIMYVSPKIFILLIAPGIKGDVLRLSINLFRVYLVNILLVTLICSYSAWFNGFKNFLIPNISNLILNIPVVLYLIFQNNPSIKYVAIYSVIGAFVQLAFLIIILIKEKYNFRISNKCFDKESRDIIKKAIPAFLGSGVNQINTIVDRIQGSKLQQGSLASLGYAYRLSNILMGVLITPITTISYPTLVELNLKENRNYFCEYISKIMLIISLITLPFVSILLLFNFEIITIIYGRGMFDIEAIRSTATLTIYIAIGLFFICIREFLYKVFYSMKEVNIAVRDGIIAMVINIILNICLTPILKVNGLALATTCAAIVSTIRLSFILRKKERDFVVVDTYKKSLKVFILTLILAAISKFIYKYINIELIVIKLFISILLYLIMFCILILFIFPEFKEFIKKIINKKIKKQT